MKIYLMASTAICAVAIPATSAVAQSTPGTTQPEATEVGETGVPPAETERTGRIDEIVVTAQRRAENVQDAPLTIDAFDAEALDERSVTSLSDLQRVSPGVSFRNSTTDNLTPLIALRGQAQTRSDLGKQPSVGLYYDGVYIPTPTGTTANGGFLDVERIEVLKGPQGTLYGRNTPAGAINIIYRRPTNEFEGLAQVYVGSNDLYGVGAVLNIPLGANAALRTVGQVQRDGGFGRDVINNTQLGDTDLEGIRSSLLFTPAADFEIIFRGDYTELHSGGQVIKNVAFIAPSVASSQAARELGLQPTPANQIFARDTVLGNLPSGKYESALSYPTFSNLRSWGGSATAAYDVSDSLRLQSISAYRNFRKRAHQDPDGIPTDVIGCDPCARVDYEQFTQEVTANLSLDRFKGVIGAYYYFLDAFDSLDSSPAPLVLPVGLIANRAFIEDESWSGFAQGTYSLTDQLNVTAGVRYTTEENVFLANNFNALFCNVPVADRIDGTCFGEFVNDFSDWSWLVGADFHFTDDVMAYLTVSRGFKAGGQNTFGSQIAGSYEPFGSEYALQYEAGLKADWLDRRLRTNFAVYYTDYTDIQRAVTAQLPGGGVTTITQNAASARIYGAEFDIIAAPVDNLKLQLAGGYTNAGYKEYQGLLGDFSDNVFPNTPEWQINGAVSYAWPMTFGDLSATVDFYHQSDVDYDPDNHSANSGVTGQQDAYTIFNARVALDLAQHGLEIAAWVKNFTNEYYFAGGVDIVAGLGTGVGYLAPPRTYGLMLTKRF